MKDLLVIVDMVNGFVNFGALADKDINKITPNIIELIKNARRDGTPIIAFQDSHSMEDEEFKIYPPHCLKGTDESELIPELKPYEKDFVVIPKNTTNGFVTPEFQKLISKNEPQNVYVTGCCTDICVSDFVLSYLDYMKKNNVKTKIFVYEDACATFGGENHDAKEFHKLAVDKMRASGAEILNVQSNENVKNL